MSRNHDCDLAVVGAGLAGLSAATAAAEAGASVLVLEARDRVGGRVLNRPLGGGAVVEVGGQWIGPTQGRINALVDHLGLERYETYNRGYNQFEFRNRLSRYKGAIPRINPLVLADIAQVQGRLDRMARQVPLDAPWSAPKAAEWDSLTVAAWLRRKAHTKGALAFFQLICEAVWAAHPSDLSLLHFLFYTHSGGGIERLISTDGGAQQHRIVGGSQLIAERMAERVGDRLILEAPVRRVRCDASSVLIDAEQVEIQASRVIVAIPPTLAGRLVYEPALPGHRDQLTQRVPQGTVIKCMAVYETPFWRADGFTGQVTSDRGPVKVTFDNSPPGGSPGVLLGFLEGNQARELGQVPAGERRAAVLGCFERFFGARAAAPLDYFDQSWAEEPFTRGCYAGYFPTGVWTGFGKALRAPIGQIHWAGAETATVWNGYMDGAITSGERAAQEVLDSIGRRSVPTQAG
jgi:monoamine oxidase